MTIDHCERDFEVAIEAHLLWPGGYAKDNPASFDCAGFDPVEFLTFV